MSVRVRFAPSPTGALHIGGVRTALYNYLFAKKHAGTFILRIEDTDQNRFVEGAEKYIQDALDWCGISPDEGIVQGGNFGPYKQSERKVLYKDYAQRLIDEGKAYYAFDTSEELDEMRNRLKEARVANPQYNVITRMQMKNSLTLSAEEVTAKLDAGEPHVIRVKLPRNEDIRFEDKVRGWVVVNTTALDDKVLMKSDGMPTYHLANIVDDHLMEITHVIRGEEWLPSAPLHVILYEFLGWDKPEFAHLPLLLKPDGNGKLSKRAADKLGFPIFPLDWPDPVTKEVSQGFKKKGYTPEALINFLALLGWNPGTEQELFSMDELIETFTLERINKAGAKFDIEKANWFNQQYLRSKTNAKLTEELVSEEDLGLDRDFIERIVGLMKERITFVSEVMTSGIFFFKAPSSYDEKMVKKGWTKLAVAVITQYTAALNLYDVIGAEEAKSILVGILEKDEVPMGRMMPALRVSITGVAGGPDLMETISVIGPKESADRINSAIKALSNSVKE